MLPKVGRVHLDESDPNKEPLKCDPARLRFFQTNVIGVIKSLLPFIGHGISVPQYQSGLVLRLQ